MKHSKRFWEIDAIRAIAFFLMLVQHTVIVWNLIFIGEAEASSSISTIGRIGAILFLLLVGMSGYILYSQKKSLDSEKVFKKFFLRGLTLLGWGLFISIFTFFAIPTAPIYFGVLSFIGLSLVLMPFLIKHKIVRWILLFIAPVLGYLLYFVHTDSYVFLPFGVYPRPFFSKDYWPMFPWISIVIAGVLVGESLYTSGKRQIVIGSPKSKALTVLQWIGSHTLFLYLIHLPILYVVCKGLYYLIRL